MPEVEKEWFNKFIKKVDDIYGVYLDSTNGYLLGKKQLENIQMRSKESISNLDKVSFIFGKGNPNTKEVYSLHICSQREFKERNKLNGKNYQIIASLCLIMIYDYWENYYRGKVAEEYGINKDNVELDIMGDLKYFRNSIIHHQGVAIPEIANCKILKWFKGGEKISLDKGQMEDVV